MTKEQLDKIAAERGFTPWGLIIPGCQHAPVGSKLYQFKKGKDELHAVVAPNGVIVRAHVWHHKVLMPENLV